MLPTFLVPEQTVSKDGDGPAVPLGAAAGSVLQLTLGITAAKEQQSLECLVFPSADGTAWESKPLTSFPQKFYTGVYTILLDLTSRPDVQFIQVRWKLNRWGHWQDGPEFTFYVFGEPQPDAA